tara:strand:+ start:4821 stop:7118 length:2298 start_codon:yes stop_codon:yes gene_type:complete
MSQSNDILVRGIIINDSTNEPMSNVNIIAGNEGATSGSEGRFSIMLGIENPIVISHIGFYPVTIKASPEFITIRLIPKVLIGENIIVMGALYEEPLRNISTSVTIRNREFLKEKNESHVQVIMETIPNVNFAGGTSRPRYFQIRGIGERSHYAGEGPPNFSVGFIMDDLDLSGLGMAGFIFDLAQVEIFKGPQSSIFGPNSMAGLISLKSVDPTDKFDASARITFGSSLINRREAFVSGPINSKLAFRLSYLSSFGSGFRNNVFNNIFTSNARDETLLRGKLKFTPTERIVILATLFRSVLDNGYDVWAPDNNVLFKTYSNDLGKDSQFTDGLSVRTTIAFDKNIKLTSISALSQIDLTHSYDSDWGNDQFWSSFPYNFNAEEEGWNYEFFDENLRKRSTVTQELRLNWHRLIVGAYAKLMIESDNASGWLYGGEATEITSQHDFKVNAAYIQFEVPFNKKINLKINTRIESNRINYNGTALGYNENFDLVQINPINYSTNHNLLGGRFSFNYFLTNNSTVFSSMSWGYKAGGVNQHPYLSNNNRFFSPEYILNAEVGYRLMAEKINFNSVLFSARRFDQQVSISSQQKEGDPNSFFYYTANATSGSLNGLEIEGILHLTRTISINSDLGLLSTIVDPFTYNSGNEQSTTLGGRGASHAPSYSYAMGINYHNDSGLFFHIELIGKDQFYFSDSHNGTSNRYEIINAHIGYIKGAWSLKLWGRNIFDERYANRGFYFGLEPPSYKDKLYVSWGDPIHYGLTLGISL